MTETRKEMKLNTASRVSRCVCVCVSPLSRRATLGSLCTGLISSSTSVCLPHSGLAWLIYKVKPRTLEGRISREKDAKVARQNEIQACRL